MKLRIAAMAFLIGVTGVGSVWLALAPLLASLATAMRNGGDLRAEFERLSSLLPLLMGGSIVLVAVLAYVALDWALARPLRQTEELISRLPEADESAPFEREAGGPLLARIDSALMRASRALAAERQVTQQQLHELTRTNEQLSRARVELESSERLAMVGRLAAGVAHEVGNPLSGILGYLSLARTRANRPEELLDYLSRVEHEVERISGIVRSLLDLGRPARFELKPLEVSSVVDRSLRLVQKSSEFQNLVVHTRFDQNAVGWGDSGALTQVLVNLFLNAAQSTEGRGEVTVRVAASPQEVSISVEDEGPGLSEEARARLFEPFFTTKGGGTGLGLAVSRHLVEQMNGRIQVEKREPKGARFVVTLNAVTIG